MSYIRTLFAVRSPLSIAATVRSCLLAFAAIVVFVIAPSATHAQGVSRWALGRPSLVIDMPADPTGGGVAWAEKSVYSIFPSAWSAEGNGVRLEVARLYTTKSPTELLAEIGQKLNTPMTPRGKGQLSGREFVNFVNATRMAAVIGNDGGVLGGASWVVVATYKDQAGQALAGSMFDSIKVEREGARHWALRSLGPTFLAAELPFELTASSSSTGINRYESSFDGMDIRVTDETPSAGSTFDKETTLRDFVEGDRGRPGVTEFTVSRERFMLGDKDGVLITKSFKRGYRSYRVYEAAFIEKRRAVVASIQMDPTRTDHQKISERILRTFKTTLNPIYGWKTYAIGKEGLYVDLPVAPSAPRQMNAVTIYESNTPLAMVEMRELTDSFPGAHDPDFAAKQYFEMQQALDSKHKYELQGIDKLLVDGMEARLVRSTWRNGQETNQRQILTIYGYETRWIIDMLASKETAAYMERVMQSVRVKVAFPTAYRRQTIGQTGVSFLVGPTQLETKVKADANDPDFAREEFAFGRFDKVLLLTYEIVFKNENPPVTDENGTRFLNSFLGGIGGAIGMKLTARFKDGFPINIDGVEGRHLIMDITADQMRQGAVIQGDFVIFQQGKKLWTAIVITNYDGGLAARHERAKILNSLRVGM